MKLFRKRNNTTELVFIIDRSGSMNGFESDTIGGFNSMIEKQKSGDGEVLVTTVLFNNKSARIHDRVSISKIQPMTKNEYQAMGCTALLDAVGSTITHIDSIHRYARKYDVPAHTIFVITTDGMENASHFFNASQVKEMITAKTEGSGWEFIFLGANIDSVEAANSIGIRSERAANYMQTREGYNACYEAMNEFVCQARSQRMQACDESWKQKLADFDN